MKKIVFAAMTFLAALGCERVDHSGDFAPEPPAVALEDVALILSDIPIGTSQMKEVHDAVGSSSGNGYDDEYMMRDLFSSPGTGVGDDATKAEAREYERPLKDMISEYVRSRTTKASAVSPEDFLSALESSDIQIYWPGWDKWDGETLPVVTFDPADGSSRNTGYRMLPDGSVDEIVVDENMAAETPVWVVNRNDDSAYTSLEMLRRQDPSWGEGSGNIVIGRTKANAPCRTLLLKDFKANRNYDTWFAGASEFFVKCAAVEDFFATTEAELKLYSPAITDFMIVVKRSEVGQVKPFNAVLVSQWSEQLGTCAFMITEDDGGTITSWKCSAEVKIKSKSYGFDISIPFNSRDDIVWRGQLSAKYFEKNSSRTGHFGDVELTFEIEEYQ